jgi:hypothetical protein
VISSKPSGHLEKWEETRLSSIELMFCTRNVMCAVTLISLDYTSALLQWHYCSFMEIRYSTIRNLAQILDLLKLQSMVFQ